MSTKTLLYLSLLFSYTLFSQSHNPQLFDFEGNTPENLHSHQGTELHWTNGRSGKALSLQPLFKNAPVRIADVELDGTSSFTVQFWVQTHSDKPTVLLSQKDFNNKGLLAQKHAGWALYTSGGTFAFTVGSGSRRVTYERENGTQFPINDGKWHQVTLSYHKELAEFRLYYDGQNRAIYKINFDFASSEPLLIGTQGTAELSGNYSPAIEKGAQDLQQLVDAFNGLGLKNLENSEFIDLIVDPKKLYELKKGEEIEADAVVKEKLGVVMDYRKELLNNPYTVFQIKELTEIKPVASIYSLKNGQVLINEEAATQYSQAELLYPSDFNIDQLAIYQNALNGQEVWHTYTKRPKAKAFPSSKKIKELNVGVWNIWHGGLHWTQEKDGWDSRMRIVEMIQEHDIDIVLLQETYSSGDFIAAELGYFFTASSDWDYRAQGSNISILSRYPIEEVQVSPETEFNNVAAKITLSDTQTIWAMSNWYGMGQFPTVFTLHESKFLDADTTPVLFGGDFNAVPHTDGGDSPASTKLLSAGFTDAYRSLHPDVEQNPGHTHNTGVRIDQLYYKGKGLTNTATDLIATWPTGYPSDHVLILGKFKLKYKNQ